LEVGDINTRYMRLVGDKLLIVQGDIFTHSKIWQFDSDYTAKVMTALDGAL
jgi:hypothetical protein